MVIAWTKQAGAKGNFRHESLMGHALGPSTTVVYVYRQQMRKKKDVFYGLLFLLHGLADLRFTNPNRNPNPVQKFVLSYTKIVKLITLNDKLTRTAKINCVVPFRFI